MKILFVNKFLYPNGGSETYVFKLGAYLQSLGHQVQYFGMEHEGRCVGNQEEVYTHDMDFHTGSLLSKLSYPVKTIFSLDAKRKMLLVLNAFQPDVVHLNNFNFQLTPSVIVAVKAFEKKQSKKVKIIFTAHDYQLVCPNHMLYIPSSQHNCERCLSGNFTHCYRHKCIHTSRLKSLIGTFEAQYWKKRGIYQYLDTVIAPSSFMADKMAFNPFFSDKIVTLHNFIGQVSSHETTSKDEYVLYFGRFSQEKGIETLIEACQELPHIQFIFAGNGPLEAQLAGVANITNVGFQKGERLVSLIQKALVSVYPSEWYENCPFSVMESQMYHTPVIGANIGGIPELIDVGKTGLLFESGNKDDLKQKIATLYEDRDLLSGMSENCQSLQFDTLEQYGRKLLAIYTGNMRSLS